VELDPDRPGTAYADGRTLFVEVQGARETVKEESYIRLQRRLEQDLLATGQVKRGLVVVNGQRRTHPAHRAEEYTRALRIACENYRYARLPAPLLWERVQIALRDGSLAMRRQLRDRIFEAEGLVDLTPVREPAAPAEGGPTE